MTKEQLSKMSAEEKRVAIAQACGWENVSFCSASSSELRFMKYLDLIAGFCAMTATCICASHSDWRGVAIFGNLMLWFGLKSIHYVLWEIHDRINRRNP